MNNEGSVGPIVILLVFLIACVGQVDAVYTICTVRPLHLDFDG